MLALLSLRMARAQGKRPLAVIGEHVGIALLVIAATHVTGHWIARLFA